MPDCICPFCHEATFDWAGLKDHLYHNCKAIDELGLEEQKESL